MLGSDTNYYDNDRLIERRTFQFVSPFWWPVQHSYFYDQEGRVNKIELRRWHYGLGHWEDTVHTYYTFEYTASTIALKEFVQFQPGPWYNNVKTYYMGNDGKPQYYVMPAMNNPNAIDSGYYTYQNGNLVELKQRKVNWNVQGSVEETITTYSGHDNHKNPFKGCYYLIGLFEEAWSENNYTSFKVFGQEYMNGVVVPQSQTLKTFSPWYFSYNGNGYPTIRYTPLGVAYDYFKYE